MARAWPATCCGVASVAPASALMYLMTVHHQQRSSTSEQSVVKARPFLAKTACMSLTWLPTCRIIAQPHPRPPYDLARSLRRLRHPLSTCRLASRRKEYMAFLRSFYVADDIWRFA